MLFVCTLTKDVSLVISPVIEGRMREERLNSNVLQMLAVFLRIRPVDVHNKPVNGL